jgi:hypothetical protein
MYKRNTIEFDKKITIDINELQTMLSVGRNTALQIGKNAGAVIKIGRRTLYRIDKIQEYMNTLTEECNG